MRRICRVSYAPVRLFCGETATTFMRFKFYYCCLENVFGVEVGRLQNYWSFSFVQCLEKNSHIN